MAFFESRIFIISLRAIQALLTLLVLGLTGYGKLPVTPITTQRTRLTEPHSGQLVGQLLERRRTLTSRIPALLLSPHIDHPRLPDRRADALRRKQSEPRRRHHWGRGLDNGLLVRWFPGPRCVARQQSVLRARV